jgi:N-acyl-D-aspartate/D-glutamate deacylase
MARVREQMARGAQVWPQVQTRPIDISFSFEQASLLFAFSPAWYMTMRLPREQKLAALRNEEHVNGLVAAVQQDGTERRWAAIRVRSVARPEDEALVGRTLGELAAERNASPARVMIDLSLDNDLKAFFLAADLGHHESDRVGPLLADPFVHIGASDGGAHIQSFSTYGDTGYLLGHYVRETGQFTLEQAIKKITADAARIWHLPNRGLLQPGYAADVTIFDPETIARGEEIPVHDMPEHGMRYVRESSGVEAVVVGGALAWSREGGYTDARTGTIAVG